MHGGATEPYLYIFICISWLVNLGWTKYDDSVPEVGQVAMANMLRRLAVLAGGSAALAHQPQCGGRAEGFFLPKKLSSKPGHLKGRGTQ